MIQPSENIGQNCLVYPLGNDSKNIKILSEIITIVHLVNIKLNTVFLGIHEEENGPDATPPIVFQVEFDLILKYLQKCFPKIKSYLNYSSTSDSLSEEIRIFSEYLEQNEDYLYHTLANYYKGKEFLSGYQAWINKIMIWLNRISESFDIRFLNNIDHCIKNGTLR